MKCPNCGRDVPEGFMYCDRCGQEFQMVPEFEPEIETQIDTILSGLASKIDGGLSNNKTSDSQMRSSDTDPISSDTKEMFVSGKMQQAETKTHQRSKPTEKSKATVQSSEKVRIGGTVNKAGTGRHQNTENRGNKKNSRGTSERRDLGRKSGAGRNRSISPKKKRVLISIPVLIVFVAVLIVTISVAHKTRADYIRMAAKAYEKGDRNQALEYLLKAEEEAPQDAEAYLLRARYFREGGDTDHAIAELVQITNSAAFSEDGLKNAYMELADIYNVTGDFEALYSLMDRCPFQELKDRYVKEILPAPVLSPEEGEYEGKVEIAISVPEGAAAVYYTLDGSEPDKSKTLYTEPVSVEKEGELIVKAVAVSDKGRLGTVQTAMYRVMKPKVKAPQVIQPSGNYSKATKIVVMADPGLTIHYTQEEKKMPDENSSVYKNPIEMPTGESFFNFVCVDDKGNKSEVVTRQYILHIERRITEQMALAYVQNELQNKNLLQEGLTFQIEGIVEIDDNGEFYFIREYKDGVPSGLLYVVNTQTGLTKRLGVDSGGQMVLMAF